MIRKITSGEFGTKGKLLGSGGFGTVYEYGGKYAIKFFKHIDSDIFREMALMQYLRCPNVMTALAVEFSPKRIIVMPLMKGTLDSVFTTLDHRKWIFYQIVKAVAYLHSKRVWHLDLKDENVLYDNSLKGNVYPTRICISDFGYASSYSSFNKNRVTVMARVFRPLEFLVKDSYDQGVDVYSIGVMLLLSIDYALGNIFVNASIEDKVSMLGAPEQSYVDRIINHPVVTGNGFDLELSSIMKRVKPVKNDLWTLLKNSTFNDTDSEEMDLLKKLMRYKYDRIDVFEALKHSYFDKYRDSLDKLLPYEINRDSCAIMLESEMTPIPGKKISLETISKIKSMVTKIQPDEPYSMMNYAMCLYNKVDENVDLKAVIYLASCLAGYDENINHFTTKSRPEGDIINICKQLDFNIIFPTAYDFLFGYIKGAKIEKDYLYKWAVNAYYLWPEYKQDEIAQITLDIAHRFGTLKARASCLSNNTKPVLLTDKMYKEFEHVLKEYKQVD